MKAGASSSPSSLSPSLLNDLRATNGTRIRIGYLPEEGRVSAWAVGESGNLQQVHSEDLPKEFALIKDSEELSSFLANAYIKASHLNNGDIKLYVHQRGLGGGKEDRNHESWARLLSGIKAHAEGSSPGKAPLKAFISYAWEDLSTDAGKEENSKLQRWLENLRDDLQAVGVSVFLDIGDMHGNMKQRMEENLKASDVIIPVVTPRFLERATKVPQTNLGFEYQLTLERAKDIPYGILPIHYRGSFDEAFGKWGDANELKELKGYLIRDCTNPEKYSDTLVGTQRPLGIIPAIYRIDCDDNRAYSNLIKNWRYEKLTLLPPANPDFTGRENLLANIADSFEKGAREKVINQKQAISGLGGVGKSELALEYSHRYGEKYVIKRWINSEGTSLKLDFEKIAGELGIDSKGMLPGDLSSEVYKKLAPAGTWLLVFDNAEDYESIKDYLPKEANKGQHILITSRSQQWKNPVTVDTFSREEALEYVARELPASSGDSKGEGGQEKAKDATKLAEAVGYLPLALSQAVAYIKQTGISVSSYLKLYREKEIEFLSTVHGIEDSAERYPKSVAQTLGISLDKVKAQSPLAARMLNAIGYLNPDNIPIELFGNKELLQDMQTVHKALQVLRTYSLIEPAKLEDHIQVHRLVQTVTRHYHSQEANREEVKKQLVDITQALSGYYPWQKTMAADYEKAKLLLPHIEAITSCLDPLCKTAAGPDKEVAPSQANLLNIAGDIFKITGEGVKSLKSCEKALQTIKALYQCNHPSVATSLNNIGMAYQALGDIRKGLEFCEQALVMYRALYQGNHPDLAGSLNNMGAAYEALGDIRKGLEFCEQALVMYRALYQGNHPDLAGSLNNVGAAYQALGDIRKGLEFCEQALVMRKALYQGNHPSVAASLNNVGIAYEALGDKLKAIELYKQAYAIRLKVLEQDYPDTQEPADYLLKSAPHFIKGVVPRGTLDKLTLSIKEKIQVSVLNKIHELAAKGKWDGFSAFVFIFNKGIKQYSDQAFLVKELGDLAKNEGSMEIAKMLCFEAIALGIMSSSTKDFTCIREFAKAYPELIKKIAQVHPEYFVDGSIVRACITDPQLKAGLLGQNPDEYITGEGYDREEQEGGDSCADNSKDNNTTYAGYWNKYSKAAIDRILELRLESGNVTGIKIISPSYIWDDSNEKAKILAREILARLKDEADNSQGKSSTIIIPLNIYNKHWTGLAIESGKKAANMAASQEGIQAKTIRIGYLDSEQQPMPDLLAGTLLEQIKGACPDYEITFTAPQLPHQSYRNCGLEVIENLIGHLTGQRIGEENVLAVHSLLLEDALLAGEYGSLRANPGEVS